MVRPDLAERGHFQVRIDGGLLRDAKVVPTPFYDADNARQRLKEAA
jgi:hypothetical protein